MDQRKRNTSENETPSKRARGEAAESESGGPKGTIPVDNFSSLSTFQASAGGSPNEGEQRHDFDTLPDEVITKLVSFLPLRQWPSLERVSRKFQRGVVSSWRGLRDGALDQFVDESKMHTKNVNERRALLTSILKFLANRSPKVEALGGFAEFMASMDLRILRRVAQFSHLKRVDISYCHLQVAHLAEFLTTSKSRDQLEELRLDQCLRFQGNVRPKNARKKRDENDEVLRAALVATSDRAALKLKKFIFRGNTFFTGGFLESMDISKLELLSVADTQVQSNHLANLLKRCTNLISLNLNMFDYFWIPVDQDGMVAIDQTVLDALESLPSPELKILNLEIGLETGFILSNIEIASTLAGIGRRCPNVTGLLMRRSRLCADVTIDAIVGNFENLTKLRLDVTKCTSACLMLMVTRLTNLKVLGLHVIAADHSFDSPVNAPVIIAIAAHQRHVTDLTLMYPIAKPSVLGLLADLPNLKKLCVTGDFITNEVISNWCQRFGRRLESLELLHVHNVSDPAMLHGNGVEQLVNIRRLSLANSRITDVTLRAIANYCPFLQELNVSGCASITKAGVQEVIDSCKSLVQLYLGIYPLKPKDFSFPRRAISFKWIDSEKDAI